MRPFHLSPASSRHYLRPLSGKTIPLVGAALVIGFLAWPILFTSSGLGGDWVNHLWELQQQSLNIRHDYLPSLFLNSSSVFIPLFAYYGGTLFSVGGALSVIVGGADRAYVLMFVLGFGAAYGGWYWLARMAGLGRWLAQVPGFVFITSGYYLTLIYGRGDWPEFMGVSAIPLMVASGLSVLRSGRLRVLPVIGLASATVLFFGSHNITSLWGTTLLALLGIAIVLAVPQARRSITPAGTIRTAIVVIPAALVNAWCLFPALAYGFRTATANGFGRGLNHSLITSEHYVNAAHLFTFSHVSATYTVVAALPMLAIAWVVVGAALALRTGRDTPWRRVLFILVALTFAVAWLMTHVHVLEALPRVYRTLQFSYRLESFLTLGLAGAVLAALLVVRPTSRARAVWLWALGAVVVASAIGAVQQVDTHPSVVADRNVVLTTNRPVSYYGRGLLYWYDDRTLPVLNSTSLAALTFPARWVRADEVAISSRLPSKAGLVATNLAGAPYLLTVSGADVAGRDADDNVVLKLPADGSSQRVISVQRTDDPPVALGRVVTFAALVFWAVAAVVQRFRPGRGQRNGALLAVAVAPLGLLSAALLFSPGGTLAPDRVTPAAIPVRLPALAACLRRRGFSPDPAMRVTQGRYTRIEVPLANGNRSVIVWFASAREATHLGAPFRVFGGVQRGRSIVLFIRMNGGVPQQERIRVESCL